MIEIYRISVLVNNEPRIDHPVNIKTFRTRDEYIQRYRIRKKLNADAEINITYRSINAADFILNIFKRNN